MKHALVIFLLIFLPAFASTSLFAQKDAGAAPERECDATVAALWGVLPGAGHLYCGDGRSAALHFGAFAGSAYLVGYFMSRDDFIDFGEQRVEFRGEDYVIAEYLRDNGWLYTDRSPLLVSSAAADLLLYDSARRRGLINSRAPIIGESRIERDARLLRSNQPLYEINPLLQYGGAYTRLNATTVNAILAIDTLRWQSYYSVYAAYRDAGGLGTYVPGRFSNPGPDADSRDDRRLLADESYLDLAVAPITPRYLFDLRVLGFLAAAAVYLHNVDSAFNLPLDGIAAPGEFARGDVAAMLVHDNLGVAVGEEALFRGIGNRRLIQALGPAGGIVAQAGVFSASHLALGSKQLFTTFLTGLFFGWIHYDSDYDLGPGIAAHFWANLIAFAYAGRSIRSDERAALDRQEIHFQQPLYTLRF